MSESSELREQFAQDAIFSEVVAWLLGEGESLDPQQRRRAKHRSEGFMIAEGKL